MFNLISNKIDRANILLSYNTSDSGLSGTLLIEFASGLAQPASFLHFSTYLWTNQAAQQVLNHTGCTGDILCRCHIQRLSINYFSTWGASVVMQFWPHRKLLTYLAAFLNAWLCITSQSVQYK